jgi:4-amino-4-deoxy-L-arabinose transferase-like glycosyltransferase
VREPSATSAPGSPHWLEYLEPLASRMSSTGLARLASAMVGASVLVLALALGIGLRTVALGSVPAGFNQDEACNGYDAYSLLHTGRDQHGNLLPIAIQAFNDYRMPLFDYSLVIPIAVFGLHPLSVRLGAALWGIADLIGLAVLATSLIGLRAAALAVLLMAISPWHLPISRFGHEAITAATTVTTAAAFLFLGLRRGRGGWLLASGLMFGISLYSYSITKAFMLPFLAWTAAIYWRELAPLRRQALLALIIIVLCALPQSVALWRHYTEMMARYDSVSTLKYPWPMAVRLIAYGWLFYFSPNFMFLNGSTDVSLHPPGYGQLLVAQAAMLFLALCALGNPRYRRVAIFLFGWLAIAALTSALILPFGHPLHSLLMVTPVTLLSALGMVFLFDLGSASRLARIAVAAAILIVLTVQGARFVRFYFRQYPPMAAYQYQYGLGPTVAHAASLGDGPVVISSFTNQPYIYVLFFTGYPPQRFQNEPVVQAKGLFAPVLRFDRYSFEDPGWAYRTMTHGVFVFTGWQTAPAAPVFGTRSPNGQWAYLVVVK